MKCTYSMYTGTVPQEQLQYSKNWVWGRREIYPYDKGVGGDDGREGVRDIGAFVFEGKRGGGGVYIVEQIFRGQNGDVMSVQYLVKLVNNPL